MNTQPKNRRSQQRSQGFVLITSAIFLVVLTILVIYAARSAIVSERGSSNMRNRSQAFQMAEYAQRWAMNQLVDVDSITFNGNNGYLRSTDSANVVSGSSYCTPNGASCNAVQGANVAKKLGADIAGVAEQPRFTIKDLGQSDSAGCTYYEVTSRGVGFNIKSVVYLRSIAKAC